MAESSVSIYRNNITLERNAKVDNIQNALGTLKASFTFFQYIKIALNLTIKVELTQDKVGKAVGNYLVIYQDSKYYYYFITKAEWVSQSCVRLYLYMDTVNTFADDFTFNAKTHIQREHDNRFYRETPLGSGTNRLTKKVDPIAEGVSPVKFKHEDKVVEDIRDTRINQLWYLVYKTPTTPTNDSPIECQLYSKKSFKIDNNGTSITQYMSRFDTNNNWDSYFIFKNEQEEHFTVTNTTLPSIDTPDVLQFVRHNTGTDSPSINYYDWRVGTISGDVITWQTWHTHNPEGENLTLSHSLKFRECNYGSNLNDWVSVNKIKANTNTKLLIVGAFPSIDVVDRTDSKNIKIVELPYCPINITFSGDTITFPEGWGIRQEDNLIINYNLENELGRYIYHIDDVLKLTDSIIDLVYVINDFSVDTIDRAREILDPKLLHSDFNQVKLVYDSFSTEIALERYVPYSTSSYFNIYYKPSNTISSNMLFQITDSFGDTYANKEDYDRMFISTRNNESPIFTNAYLNYTRTGLNFDRKNQTANNITTALGIVPQVITTVAGAVAGFATGGVAAVGAMAMIGNSARGLVSNIISMADSEKNIQQKLIESKSQATAIAGSDDLNLMNYYNGNKLHWMTYRPSANLSNLIDDLFYYTGYARDKQDIPNVTSRYWFNYIKCEAVFNEETDTPYVEYLDDIKQRYNIGVTVYHNHNNVYDWNQEKENWEVALIPEEE